ncbi:MAG: hypothetical protein HOI95_13685, partial [Chromatiales bacterium]|nr:hypothetical protein [Chromatiales bacterium]
ESVFSNLMLAVIAVLLVWIVILGIVKIPWGGRGDAAGDETDATQAIPAPPFARLLGLAGLVVALLVLNWTYLDRATQHGLVLNVAYPAAFALAVVLLFDKATRAWSVKTASEHAREWLHCDLMVFLLAIGYLNLRSFETPAEYGGLFWDALNLALFALAFWLVDRKLTRHRFLLSYAYFIALPVLLIIWRAVQGIETDPNLSWWSTQWPFFLLATIFFIFEIIALIVTDKPDNQAGRITKDAIFVALYGITLLVAIPTAQ